MAKLLEGKALAEKIKSGLRLEVAGLKAVRGAPLVLASIEIGRNDSARMYTNIQKKTAESLGIEYRLHTVDKNISEKELFDLIAGLNADEAVNGIIVQMPVPAHLDARKLSALIAVDKDVEGVHPSHIGELLFGREKIIPCTAAAVMELIKESQVELAGKDVVIVGHSEIVGKPLCLLLLNRLATVSVCHIATSQAGRLRDYVARAEVLIVAVGKAELIPGEWIKEGAVVIDVGINRSGDKTVGDIAFEQAEMRASWITPVPGGVGPLTVTMLMRNLVEAAKGFTLRAPLK
ncbi:MAG: bifunctional 5,10-methylenetetrahydrofolate dehydrogenase/5,10-methenyltetrahydrofolate cyclohydrolase [Candidatus Omnitrophota bacterium]